MRLWDAWPHLRDTPQGRAVRDAMELGLPTIVEYRAAAADVWLEARVYPATTGVHIFGRDISARKRAEQEREALVEALRDSEQRYAALFEKSPFAMTLSSLPGFAIVDVNDAFLALFEYTSRDQVLGRTSTQLGIADEASRADIARRFAADGSRA